MTLLTTGSIQFKATATTTIAQKETMLMFVGFILSLSLIRSIDWIVHSFRRRTHQSPENWMAPYCLVSLSICPFHFKMWILSPDDPACNTPKHIPSTYHWKPHNYTISHHLHKCDGGCKPVALASGYNVYSFRTDHNYF